MAERISVLEIHDAGLVWVGADGVRAQSPSVAVASDEGLLVGSAAARLSRRNPRRTLERFWEQLDQDPLPLPLGPARSRADVAYFHLRALWAEARRDEAEVLLSVPAAFSRSQRALLVGIVRACEIPLAGLVEAGVAAAATVDDPRPRAVLDVGLHRATVTTVAADDGLSLGESRTVAVHGLAHLRELWIERIAARFLREARFDPLHDAQTEQLLHDCLPAWLATLESSPVAVLELPAGERRVRVEMPREALIESARPTYEALAGAAVALAPLVLVSSRAGALPGLFETIRARAVASLLEPGASGRAALAHAAAIRSDGAAPTFVTRLPAPIAGAPRARGAPRESEEGPTHVLDGARAYAIGGAPLWLDPEPPRRMRLGEIAHGSVVRLRGTEAVLDVPEGVVAAVNGRAVAGALVLRVGDFVRLGGTGRELRAIRLEAEDGPP